MARIVLITGCSGGIGDALARAFLERGDKVIATARRTESLNVLKQLGCDVLALDVTDQNSIDELAAEVSARYGKIDMLVNNAGSSEMGPVIELPVERLRGQFETNVIGPIALSQALLPNLRNGSDAAIVNIGSVSGILTTPFAGAYCASKAALHALSEAMRMELLGFGIRVITVQPGGIESNFGEAAEKAVSAWMSDDSLYLPVREGILSRAQASQKGSTPATDFAEEVVKALDAGKGPVIRAGAGSGFLPFMARWFPVGLRTKILSKRFGLDHDALSKQ